MDQHYFNILVGSIRGFVNDEYKTLSRSIIRLQDSDADGSFREPEGERHQSKATMVIDTDAEGNIVTRPATLDDIRI